MNSNSSVRFAWKSTTVFYQNHTDYIRLCKEILLYAWDSTSMMEKSHILHTAQDLHCIRTLANDIFPCYKKYSIAEWLNYIIYNKLTISPNVVPQLSENPQHQIKQSQYKIHQKQFGNIFCYEIQFFIIGKNVSTLTYNVIFYVVDKLVLHVCLSIVPINLNG